MINHLVPDAQISLCLLAIDLNSFVSCSTTQHCQGSDCEWRSQSKRRPVQLHVSGLHYSNTCNTVLETVGKPVKASQLLAPYSADPNIRVGDIRAALYSAALRYDEVLTVYLLVNRTKIYTILGRRIASKTQLSGH